MLRLYDNLISGNGYKVRLLLTQLGLDFERVEMDIFAGATRRPDFLARNANGRIPTLRLEDGDELDLGEFKLRVMHTPGHTPEHMTFLLRDLSAGDDEPSRAVTGDFVFVGDLGRPDLLESAAGIPGMSVSSARSLYLSVQKSMEWPDDLELWPGHGAGSACGKALGSAPFMPRTTSWSPAK